MQRNYSIINKKNVKCELGISDLKILVPLHTSIQNHSQPSTTQIVI